MQLTVQSKEVQYIEFTEDQCLELGIKEGDQFSIEVEDGAIKLVPFQPVEINLDELDRSILEELIITSVEENVSVNEVIRNIIDDFLEKHEE